MALEPFAAPDPDADVQEFRHAITSPRGLVGMRLPVAQYDSRNALDHLWWNHMAAQTLRSQVAEDVWATYPRLATVRNPFDRLISMFLWEHYSSHRARAEGRGDILETLSFDELKAQFRHFVLTCDWPTDEEILSLDGRICIDFPLRYEHLAADLLAACNHLGIDSARLRLPETKVTRMMRRDQPLAAFFDDETTALVRDRMGWAINAFGYPDRPEQMQ